MNRKWRYHADCREGKIFEPDEDPGEGWVDTPANLPPIASETLAPVEEVHDRKTLLAMAEERGIEVDKRWSITKLQEALK